MQKLLAVAVLGASLALASGAAFAEDRGVVEPVTFMTQDQANLSTVAGGPASISEVDTSRENSNNR